MQQDLLFPINRNYDPASGQFTQQDPIGIAGGANVYGFAGGDPVNFSDPFGLKPDDVTYDEKGKETKRVVNGQPDRHFLYYKGETFQLDYGLVEGSTPYEIAADPASFDKLAAGLAENAPVYGNRVSIAMHSLPGGSLDFKRELADRSLYNAGGGLMTHKHAVGNAAWGNYMKDRGYPLSTSLRGASVQGSSRGGEDSLDQTMIRRGYAIP